MLPPVLAGTTAGRLTLQLNWWRKQGKARGAPAGGRPRYLQLQRHSKAERNICRRSYRSRARVATRARVGYIRVTVKDGKLVYSSAAGRICKGCGQPERGCRCGRESTEPIPARPIARLRMEKAGRGGKTVTVVFGLPNNTAFLKDLAADLKKACGTGGTATSEGVELQGDLRERVREILVAKGFQVKG